MSGLLLRTFLCTTVILLVVASALPAAEYRIERLGNLGGMYSKAMEVTAQGAIVGYATTPGGAEHAFLYDTGLMQDLGTRGGDTSRAYGANDTGLVVGWAQDAAGDRLPTRWDNGIPRALPTLGAAGGTARGVNASGMIVGHSYLATTTYHATAWQEDGVTDLGTLGGNGSVAYAVNATGVVAGGADDVTGTRWACLWSGSGRQNLGGLTGASSSVASDINDRGQATIWNYGISRASLWDTARMIDLGTLGGDESWAYGLNNQGEVVGWAELPSGVYHAFLWRDADGNGTTGSDEMLDLGTLGGLFSSAYGINDDGYIVGYAQDETYQWQAVQWVPVPEPGTASLALVGLAAVLCRFRGSK